MRRQGQGADRSTRPPSASATAPTPGRAHRSSTTTARSSASPGSRTARSSRPRPEAGSAPSSPRIRSRTCGATWSPPTSSSCSPPTRRATAWTARVGRSQDTTASSGCTTPSCVQARVDSAPLTSSSNGRHGQLPLAAPRRRQRPAADRRRRAVAAGRRRLRRRHARSAPTWPDEQTSRARSFAPTRASTWYRPFGSLVRQRARSRPARCSCTTRSACPTRSCFAPAATTRCAATTTARSGRSSTAPSSAGACWRPAASRSSIRSPTGCRQLLGAVFVDAGNAADRWRELHPVFGYGVGLHYRSPVGPLRLDVAYGQSDRQVRLHLSVGVTF